jgi:hypothetical protein
LQSVRQVLEQALSKGHLFQTWLSKMHDFPRSYGFVCVLLRKE